MDKITYYIFQVVQPALRCAEIYDKDLITRHNHFFLDRFSFSLVDERDMGFPVLGLHLRVT